MFYICTGINYVRLCKLDATLKQLVNGEGREKQWSGVMCNLTTQWAVPSTGPLNAGSVREINSRVSPLKNMINTPPGDAAEDEVGAAGSGSVGMQGEVEGPAAGAAKQRGQRVGHTGSSGRGGTARALQATKAHLPPSLQLHILKSHFSA